jgi:hypothetical protein
VKDVLRHEAAAEHAHKNRELYAGATEGRDGMWSIEDNAAGLEVVLEEALSRTKAFADGVTSIVNRVFNGTRQTNRGRPSQVESAEAFELRAEEA